MNLKENINKSIITDLQEDKKTTRRDFLKKSLLFTGTILTSKSAFAYSGNTPKEKVLRLNCSHTNEKYEIMFHNGYSYDLDGLFLIDKALRDYRENKIYNIDINLVNLLYNVQKSIGKHREIQVVSGYRTPKTNRRLARYYKGVAKHSYHMKGQAVDICSNYYSTYKLKELVKSQKRGGVGYYPKHHFVHMDVGPIRHWRG